MERIQARGLHPHLSTLHVKYNKSCVSVFDGCEMLVVSSEISVEVINWKCYNYSVHLL